jgi:hypothetical protein
MGLTRDGLQQLWTNILVKMDERVEKVDGKGLSTNDFTDEEKLKLANISETATGIIVDSSLSSTSDNPVQNKVITTALDNVAKNIPIKLSELANDKEYVTESELNQKGYLTQQSLEGYATEDYVDNAIAAIPEPDLSEYVKKEDLPEGVDLSEYAKKSDIPDVSEFITSIPNEYITESELNAKGYLTEHQDISGKADVNHKHPEYLTEHQDLSEYAKKSDIPEGQDLSQYAKKTDIPDVSGKADKVHSHPEYLTEHQDLSEYAKKSDIPEGQDLSKYALKTDIPDVSDFISEIPSEYITESELEAKKYLTEHQSLAGYATESFVTNKIAEAKLEGGGGSSEPIDLSGYATKDDIKNFITEESLVGYVTEDYVNEAIADKIDTSALNSAIESAIAAAITTVLNTPV